MSSSTPASLVHPPAIEAIRGIDARPAISVVIPTFEPQRFLLETLKSALDQELGDDQLQIVIVDDSSKRTNVRELVARIHDSNRLELREHSDTLGLAGNWNRAISYARGEFIHILHQDDVVSPGFYRALLAGMRRSPNIGMGFCRHAFIDENGRTQRISHRERWRAGVLRNWLERISERQRLQCPAAIVRRTAYETLGGFRPDLRYALDWEMWVRIAARYDVWYEPKVLASYRRHQSTESVRLEAAGAVTADMLAAIATLSSHLPMECRVRLQQRAYKHLAHKHVSRAEKLAKAGDVKVATNHVEAARAAFDLLLPGFRKRWLAARLLATERRLADSELQANS